MSQFFHLTFFQLIFCLCCTSKSVESQELNDYQSNGKYPGSSYFFYQQPDYPRDCFEARDGCSTSNLSGVYFIKPDGFPEPFEVYCDNTVDFGGWTVIQRLEDGSILFNRNWTEYKTGFGFLSQEFWLGNDKLSFLTNQKIYELRIDFTSVDGLSFYITYNRFRISDEFSEYKLASVGDYSGTEDNITSFLCPPDNDDVVIIYPGCSTRCSCNGGQLTCDDDFQCSPNAVCEDRNNGSQCYCNAGYVGDGVNCTFDIPSLDCQDVYERISNKSGFYKLKPTTWPGDPFDVYCNMTDGVGWTVIQRRVDGSEDFNLYWSDYQVGFGTLDHEFWLGNDKINNITTQKTYELRIDIVNSLGNPYYALYSSFSISDESDNYRLSLGSYSGNAGANSMSGHNGKGFSTRERDNDAWSGGNCVSDVAGTYYSTPCNFRGGWWFHTCSDAALNSAYGTGCFQWDNLPGNPSHFIYTQMKIRPTDR